MAAAIFWGAIALVVYVYAGYPCLIFLLAHLRPRPVRKAPVLPPVSFIIAAYNEERVIAAKLENTFALDYPPERLEVMVVSDGSTDATEEIVRTRFAGRVKLLALPRQGAHDLLGRVGRAVGDHHHLEALGRIVEGEGVLELRGDHPLLVVGGDDEGHRRQDGRLPDRTGAQESEE